MPGLKWKQSSAVVDQKVGHYRNNRANCYHLKTFKDILDLRWATPETFPKLRLERIILHFLSFFLFCPVICKNC